MSKILLLKYQSHNLFQFIKQLSKFSGEGYINTRLFEIEGLMILNEMRGDAKLIEIKENDTETC